MMDDAVTSEKTENDKKMKVMGEYTLLLLTIIASSGIGFVQFCSLFISSNYIECKQHSSKVTDIIVHQAIRVFLFAITILIVYIELQRNDTPQQLVFFSGRLERGLFYIFVSLIVIDQKIVYHFQSHALTFRASILGCILLICGGWNLLNIMHKGTSSDGCSNEGDITHSAKNTRIINNNIDDRQTVMGDFISTKCCHQQPLTYDSKIVNTTWELGLDQNWKAVRDLSNIDQSVDSDDDSDYEKHEVLVHAHSSTPSTNIYEVRPNAGLLQVDIIKQISELVVDGCIHAADISMKKVELISSEKRQGRQLVDHKRNFHCNYNEKETVDNEGAGIMSSEVELTSEGYNEVLDVCNDTNKPNIIALTSPAKDEIEKNSLESEQCVDFATNIKADAPRSSSQQQLDMRNNVTDEIKTGWLLKCGHVRKNWNKRWFVLEKGVLRYYKSAMNDAPFGKDLKGEIHLDHFYAEIFDKIDNEADCSLESKEVKFCVYNILEYDGAKRVSRRKSLFSKEEPVMLAMKADSRSSAEGWVEAINEHIDYFYKSKFDKLEVDDILSEGWLEKKSSLTKKFHKKWFVLKPNKIEYFDNENCNKLAGQMHLHSEVRLMIRDGFTRLYKFAIMSKSNRLELSAANESERQTWMTMINKVCRKDDKNGEMSFYYPAPVIRHTDAFHDTDVDISDVDIYAKTGSIMLEDGKQAVAPIHEMVSVQTPFTGDIAKAGVNISLTEKSDIHQQNQNAMVEAVGDNADKTLQQRERISDSAVSLSLTSNVQEPTQRGSTSGHVDAPFYPNTKDNSITAVESLNSDFDDHCTMTRERVMTQEMLKMISAEEHMRQAKTLEVLRKQLEAKGEMPLEFIPLDELQAEIANIFKNINNGESFDEGRLDYLLHCLELNPEHKANLEKEREEWREEVQSYCQECFQEMRGFIPSHIFDASVVSLVDEDGLSKSLAKRFFMKKCLMLVRLKAYDISKMHIAELSGRFNPSAQGLDIVEMASIYHAIPKSFLNDHDGKKELWKKGIEESFKKLYQQKKTNSLPKNLVRCPSYKDETPSFQDDDGYYEFSKETSCTDNSDKFLEDARTRLNNGCKNLRSNEKASSCANVNDDMKSAGVSPSTAINPAALQLGLQKALKKRHSISVVPGQKNVTPTANINEKSICDIDKSMQDELKKALKHRKSNV